MVRRKGVARCRGGAVPALLGGPKLLSSLRMCSEITSRAWMIGDKLSSLRMFREVSGKIRMILQELLKLWMLSDLSRLLRRQGTIKINPRHAVRAGRLT